MGKMTAAVFMAALTFAVCGCTERPSEKKPDTGTLRRGILDTLDLMTEYSTSGRYGDLLETVLPLYNEAVRMGNDTGQIVFGSGVAEAVSMLSDPENDIPLKAMFSQLGFNSTSTFYRVFQNATGVPPSRYRKESRRIAG